MKTYQLDKKPKSRVDGPRALSTFVIILFIDFVCALFTKVLNVYADQLLSC